MLRPEIDAAVASPDVAVVSCDVVASGETAEARPDVVASGLVAVVIAPVIVDVDVVTLVAVARPDRSDTFAREPDVRVLSVRLRVPYDQTSDAAIMLDDDVVPPVTVLVDAYVLFQTSAAREPNAVRVLVGEAQTSAAVML